MGTIIKVMLLTRMKKAIRLFVYIHQKPIKTHKRQAQKNEKKIDQIKCNIEFSFSYTKQRTNHLYKKLTLNVKLVIFKELSTILAK